MNTSDIIAVIGGTGKSGQYLVRQLLQQGFQIKLLVRNPERYLNPSDNVQVIHGNIKDYATCLKLVNNCKAVISTLGMGIPPDEPTLFSKAAKNVIDALRESHIKRYIVTTGLMVNTNDDRKGPATRAATEWMYANYPISTADRQLEYEMLNNSGCDWTLVRLPLIEQTEIHHQINISTGDCPGDKISATSLAHFLIGQLVDTTYICQAPFIANP